MHKQSPLSIDQIEQLKIELNKIQEASLLSFPQRLSKSLTLGSSFQFDTVYEFSLKQHERVSKELQNVLRFAFSILSNFQVLWEEVSFRDSKLSELRETFASATTYIQQLKENYELKKKLTQAETYIEWIQQQKQCLDAMYEDRCSSTTVPSTKNIAISRCVSQSSLRWSESRVKNSLTFQKLKDYIDRLRDQRKQYQNQLLNLHKRYEIKCQQSKKANLFIQHLVERLNKRHQLRQCIDISMNPEKNIAKNQFITDEILQILQRNQRPSSCTSLKNHLEAQTDCLDRLENIRNYYPTQNHINDTSFRELNRSQSISSALNHIKQTKDAQICTESQILKCQTAETQTQNKENKNKQKKIDYKISIHITGQQNQDISLQKVLKSLHLQKKIETTLKSKIIKCDKQKTGDQKETKVESKNSRLGQILDYYHQRWVSNRIKKYIFLKPDTKPIYKFYKK